MGEGSLLQRKKRSWREQERKETKGVSSRDGAWMACMDVEKQKFYAKKTPLCSDASTTRVCS